MGHYATTIRKVRDLARQAGRKPDQMLVHLYDEVERLTSENESLKASASALKLQNGALWQSLFDAQQQLEAKENRAA